MFDKLTRIYIDKFLASEDDPLKKSFAQYFIRYYATIKSQNHHDKIHIIASCFALYLVSSLTAIYYRVTTSPVSHFYFFTMVGILDNMMDNNISSKAERIQKVQMIYNIIYANDKPSDPTLHIFHEIWNHASEKLKETIKSCYNDACRSFIEQYNTNDEQVLKRACTEAGKNTLCLVCSILGLDYDKEELAKIGYCLQTCDNMIDVNFDLRDKIKTNATFVFERDGNLDNLINELVTIIEQLKEPAIKAIGVLALNHTIYITDHFSEKMRTKVRGDLLLTKIKSPAVILGNSLNNMIIRMIKEEAVAKKIKR